MNAEKPHGGKESRSPLFFGVRLEDAAAELGAGRSGRFKQGWT
jgi:hypothetical protein